MSDLFTLLKHVCETNNNVIILNDKDVKHIQKRILHILDDVLEVCNNEKINYQLSSGSALGAIRHQGYIPWDDDIDINMERQELDRFITAFEKQFSDKYYIHVPGKTADYDFAPVHIYAKDIKARGIMHAKRKESGIGIDIFPIENVFDNKVLRSIQGFGSLFFRYVLSCLRIRDNIEELNTISVGNDELMKYLRKRNRLASFFLIIPRPVWIKLSYKWATICKNNHSKMVSIPSGIGMFFKEMYSRESFCKTENVLFEGRNVRVTSDYDRYLSLLYGEYMKLPPPHKRERHVMMELDREALYRCV